MKFVCKPVSCAMPDGIGVNSLLKSVLAGILLTSVSSVAFGVESSQLTAESSAGQDQVAHAQDPLASELSGQRERFVEARNALAAGDLESFHSLQESLADYPLSDFLEFERLNRLWRVSNPDSSDVGTLNAFEQRTGDASLTRRLTRTLQKRFSQTEQWPLFKGISESRLAATMPCTTLQAQLETGALTGFSEAALAQWVKPRKHPQPCASVLSKLESEHTPPVAAIWEKIYQAMEANKPAFAEPMLGYLASRDRSLVKQWLAAGTKPQVFLASGALDEDTVLNRRIIADLLVDWSREDTPAAIKYWLNMRDDYLFYRDRYYDTHRALAMRAAYRRLPQAHEWLMAIKVRDDDLELMEWRVRTALLAEDWSAVRSSIAALPAQEQAEDHWAYWEARALEQMGEVNRAKEIYTELAELQSYHGFLAADRLQSDYAIYDQPMAPSSDLLAKLSVEPALVRAREFRAVDLAYESRREWNNWISGRNDEELSAAAVLASQWGLHDRAIYTASFARNKRAIKLRFPVLYSDEVAAASSQYQIEPSWIFGVMRRESAYIRDIKSGAGAVGLMQLMPRTARYVAELQGDKNWQGDLTDSATNIGFGTFYLRHVMNQFDEHQVLTTAGYNAGPHRVDNWLRESSVEADIWIDTIPFTETRRYVRAVMAYAAIYEYHLTGKPQRLSSKLTVIPAAPGV